VDELTTHHISLVWIDLKG